VSLCALGEEVIRPQRLADEEWRKQAKEYMV